MSIREVTNYTIACDWPECGVTADDDGEYACWGDVESAQLSAADADGWVGQAADEWYCNSHPATWSSDHENGEPYPAPPFLLIHDGDTGVDDGSVSLVEHLHEGQPCVPGRSVCPSAEAAQEAASYDALLVESSEVTP